MGKWAAGWLRLVRRHCRRQRDKRLWRPSVQSKPSVENPFSKSTRLSKARNGRAARSAAALQIAGYSSETGKRRFASDCVVGLEGLEVRRETGKE
jgi:hypothetical protein